MTSHRVITPSGERTTVSTSGAVTNGSGVRTIWFGTERVGSIGAKQVTRRRPWTGTLITTGEQVQARTVVELGIAMLIATSPISAARYGYVPSTEGGA